MKTTLRKWILVGFSTAVVLALAGCGTGSSSSGSGSSTTAATGFPSMSVQCGNAACVK